MSSGLDRADIWYLHRATRDPDAAFQASDVDAGTALSIDVASPRFLLAMKLFSARVENDADDIRFLYRQVGFSTVEEGLDLVAETYQGRPVQAKVQYLLDEIVESLNRETGED